MAHNWSKDSRFRTLLGVLKPPKNLAQPKKHGKNKATPFLNVFEVPDSESEVRISIKKFGYQVIKFDDFVCLQLYSLQGLEGMHSVYIPSMCCCNILDPDYYIQLKWRWLSSGYVVYTCKVPAVMEGFKKIRVVFFKINDWINDGICNLNLIFCRWNKYLRCSLFFLYPETTAG